MSIEKPPIYPTLVIGLGGAGTEVVRHVKRRFRRIWQLDELDELPSILQVMAVDTEPLVNGVNEEPLYFHEYAFLGKFDATRLVQYKDNHSPYLDWWQFEEQELPLGYIHNGARQLRPIGRLAFFRQYVKFKTMLQDKLQTMGEFPDIHEAEERGFAVQRDLRLIFIVSSLCGGTGAGMFLDVAHRVRHEVGAGASILGIFLMPSVFAKEIKSDIQRRRIQANAYAALRELNYFQLTSSFQALYPSEQGPLPEVRRRPFTRIFLIERTNDNGQSLSSKASVCRMVAHFIALNAVSHLNRRLLGLDVNVTEEREESDGSAVTGISESVSSSTNKRRSYLAYSSFSTSALVVPTKPLWNYFLNALANYALYQLQGDEEDQNTWKQAAKDLATAVTEEFSRHMTKKDELDRFIQGLEKKEEVWKNLKQKVHEAERKAFEAGGFLATKRVLANLMLDPKEVNEASHETWELVHSKARPFSPPEKSNSGLSAAIEEVLSTLQSPQARKQREDRRLAQTLAEKREEAWQKLLSTLRILARSEESLINAMIKQIDRALDRVNYEIDSIERSLHPLWSLEDDETDTYYDLETGAVSGEFLEDLFQKAFELMKAGKPLDKAEGETSETASADGDAPKTPWDQLIEYLRNILWPKQEDGGRFVTKDELALIQAVFDAFAPEGPLYGYREQIQNLFDLRTIVEIQYSRANGRRPPNDRMNQWLGRARPHIRVDGDTYPHSEADEEHVRTATEPAWDDKGYQVFEKAKKTYGFEWVTVPNKDRVDACYVVHGIPIERLASMPDLYRHYHGGQFGKYTLHVVEKTLVDDPNFFEPYQPPSNSRKQSP